MTNFPKDWGKGSLGGFNRPYPMITWPVSVTRCQATADLCLPGNKGALKSMYTTKLSKASCGKERWEEVNI